MDNVHKMEADGKTICRSCGRSVDIGTVFCDNCGYSFPRAVELKDDESFLVDTGMTKSEYYAVTVAGKKLMDGIFWNIIRRENSLDYIKGIHESNNMVVRFINEFSVIEVNPDFIIRAIESVQNKGLDVDLMSQINKQFSIAQYEFEMFMVYKGIYEEGFCGKVAIYHTVNTPTVIVELCQYPAFCLCLDQTMRLMREYGYTFKVGEEYVFPDDALNGDESFQKVWNSLTAVPVRTGVLVEIKATLSAQEYEDIAKQKGMEFRPPSDEEPIALWKE